MDTDIKTIKLSEIPSDRTIDDYPDDTIFVFEDKPIIRDPVTGQVIKNQL